MIVGPAPVLRVRRSASRHVAVFLRDQRCQLIARRGLWNTS